MDDLVQFLRARLDEDEQTAVRARDAASDCPTSPTWYALLENIRQGWEVFTDQRRLVTSGIAEADARHIARHDPARVLAEIDAKRQLVSLHEPLWETVEWPHDQNGKGEAQVCKSCGNRDIDSWQNWRPAVGEAGYLPPGVVPPYILAPCQTLRLLALPYADHTDYREEWRPTSS